MRQRIDVHFTGHVQGVGFRHTTSSLAAGFEVTGFVQNLPDGRVRLVAEGEPDEIEGLVAAVEDRMSRYIRQTDLRRGIATGEFPAFETRH